MNAEPGKKVSLLLMTYNCEDHLKQTLKSITEQDYPSIETVIIDGGSTDGTVEIIRNFADAFTKGSRSVNWVSEKDNGLYDALNKAVDLATGNYLMVANDILVRQDAVSLLVRAAAEGNNIGAHSDLVYADGDTIKRYWHMGNSGNLMTGWMPGHPTLLLKKEIYDRYGKYRTDYKVSSDYEFMLRVFRDRENRLGYVPEVLVKMYYGGVSTQAGSGYRTSLKEAMRALKENDLPVYIPTFMRTCRLFGQYVLAHIRS